MKLRNKLALSFLLIGALFAVEVFITIQSNQHLEELVEEAVDQNQMAVGNLNRLILELQKLRRYEKEYFIYIGDAVKKRHYEFEWRTSLKRAREMLAQMMSTTGDEILFSEEERQKFMKWKAALDFYAAEFAKIIQYYSEVRKVGEKAKQATAMHSVDANAMIKAGKNRLSAVMKEITAISEERQARSHQIVEDIEASFETVKWILLGLFALVLIVAMILIRAIPGALTQGIEAITEGAKRLAQGDYGRSIEPTGVEELDELAQYLEQIRVRGLKK